VAYSTDVLKSQIDRQRDDLGRDLDALGDRLSPRRIVDRRKEAVANSVRSVREKVMGTASETTAHLSSAADTLSEAPDMARRQVEGNPIAAGVLAFAAGLVVAALVPQTEPEQEMVAKIQPGMEQVAGDVGRAAQESVDQVRPAVQEAAHHVADQARESAETVRDQVRQS
jgi:ElaB/YqjD/DUF883 family membrane-anchored ribosome-binding protein